ncbi:guanine nucleotide-binding protein subunit alpha [Puccinia graminis f. sp. tritici]|uniref:Guanine nucleotide-binding protein subunit alpha n=2 Tax=Puccinia graminis f. sp. tritici TaxID=56615 RepID=E3K0X3_PUCGT|nr:guanine nucleotide-binding protein subunit alpha [Puccinia graminis f. sp. tritici CRL 75-36-700-3]EFP77948.1 guanine nucleotide-binding protein subunit alpha [Puccinia graminis f. sp. tritici CRL 75-36-700-3]KAA1089744.1 guanine nucleotide-binding protein subunit alpha [Puccinia graminis f. sp. tritici]KAA1125301.1 guanine nucleotide-binding protein subunit alpha [Puccinia graminis f. sp. tritici]
MGCSGSKEISEAQQVNAQIESQIKRDKISLRNEIKMLLLGAGESGKSTILKQMKLIHEGSYTNDERDSYKEIIFSNTIQSMHVILDAMQLMQIELKDPSLIPVGQMIQSLPSQLDKTYLDPHVVTAIRQLWQDPGVRKCFERSREYQLNDSAAYYFDSIDRIGQRNYVPDDQDVLRSRVKTTGITETVFVIGELKYRMFDVGGQRSERKKWIHCFENVTAIVFLVALSEYDQMLYEDDSVNRMQEALNLFDSICNSRWFIKTSIILFLNKIDLFKQKVRYSPIQNFFPNFHPPSNPDQELWQAGADFFGNKFVSVNQSPSKQVYVHLTCATDTSQIRFVLSAVNDIIIQLNLRECGLL